MTVLRKRTRIVSFRVTDDEYDELQKICEAQGAQSISDYTRCLALPLEHSSHHHVSLLAAQVHDLDSRVEEISRELKRLAAKAEQERTAGMS